MRNTNRIPADILATAKKLNPYATLANKPGEGFAVASYLIGDQLKGIMYYVAVVKATDGRFYLVYNFVEASLANLLGTNIALQSPFQYKIWDENGVIRQWASGQQKYPWTVGQQNYLY